MNLRYWQARTHAIGWRRAQEDALRKRLDHHESVGAAFVGTVAWICLIVITGALLMLLADGR